MLQCALATGTFGPTAAEPLRFLERFRAQRFEDLSVAQWMTLVPTELVQAHLSLDSQFIDGLRK